MISRLVITCSFFLDLKIDDFTSTKRARVDKEENVSFV